MYLAKQLSLDPEASTVANKSTIRFPWISSSSTSTGTSAAIPQSAPKTNDSGDNEKTSTTTPTPAELIIKPSYLILDEPISLLESFKILGRLVANVKRPLIGYRPAQVIPGATIPGIPSTSSGEISNRALITDGATEDDVREIEENLVFSNLPYTISSSAQVRITHRSQYSTKTNSLLKAILGISISSSTASTTTYNLKSDLVRTLSLTQQDLVWAALLGCDEYKKDIMTAVRNNRGKMFFVTGVKVARDAVVQGGVSGGRNVCGKMRVDVGSGVGAQGLARVERISSRKDGEGTNVGVLGSLYREVVVVDSRSGRLFGDNAFAVEYREVKLRLKVEIGGSRSRGDKKGKAAEDDWKPAPVIADLQKQLQELRTQQELWHEEQERLFNELNGHWNSAPDYDLPTDSRDGYDGNKLKSGDCYDEYELELGDDYDEYELELGEEVYMQETDALW